MWITIFCVLSFKLYNLQMNTSKKIFATGGLPNLTEANNNKNWEDKALWSIQT